MDPFQRAREEAVKLRDRLLGARSAEAVHVQEFLTPAPIEARLELGLEYVARGAQELGNVDAILRRTENAIYVRNDFNTDERAYLVAHELGHWILDDDKGAETIASLTALASVEGSPGVITVEAYGARERQELRANVFARELQLPRAVARRLYEGGIGPRKVAADFGIHLEVARQQMLDAVMLPDLSVATITKKLHPPTTDQRQAAEAQEQYANVVAGPGSGKTLTLVHRVKHLIEQRGVDPSQILVMTFTNKAAFELVERLRDAGIANASNLWAGTFHAFGLEFLRKYHQHFGLDAEINVADKLSAITMLNADLPNIELGYYMRVADPYEWLPDVVNGIKRLKEQMVTPAQYRAAIAALPADEDLITRRLDVATLYERHERLMRTAKLVDFVDLVAMPAEALERDRPRYSDLADKFQHVLVDEYQDVTFAMVQLVKQLARKKSLWVVGDVRQAVHHWRGASVDSLRKFAQTFKEQAGSGVIREYSLALNRRNSPEILELVKHVGRQHFLESDLPLPDTEATSGQGPCPKIHSCTPASSMPEAITAEVKRLHGEGVQYREQAILSRKKGELHRIAAGLRQMGVPVLYVGELAQRTEVKRLLCLMQLLVERQPRGLIGLMSWPSLAMEMKGLRGLLKACKENLALQRGGWLKNPPREMDLATQNVVAALQELLRGQRRSASPWSFVCDMLLERRFGYAAPDDQSVDAHAARIALWQFAYATRTGDSDRKIPTVARFLLRQQLRQRIGDTYADRELPLEAAAIDAVHLMSVHGSKGLEFEAVHLAKVTTDAYGPDWPGWMDKPDILQIVPPEVLGSDQRGWDDEAAVERNNLFYVAVSRARRHLSLYEDGKDTKKRAPQVASADRRWPRISFTSAQPVPLMQRAVAANAAPGQPVDFAEFETYARCSQRHWYQYTLAVPGEQSIDVSGRARWAVAGALQSFAADQTQTIKEAFLQAWDDSLLPSKQEDPQLWMDAVAVFKAGVERIRNSAGTYAQPVTIVDGLSIQLPWLLLDSSTAEPTVEQVKLNVGSLQRSVGFMRPMLNGMEPRGAVKVTIFSLMSNKELSGRQSGALTKTNAYAAVQRWRATDISPSPDKHCAWCPYSTLCPMRPTH